MARTKRPIKSADLHTVAVGIALAYAIEALDMMPEERQPATDLRDRVQLLGAVAPHGNAETMRPLARARLEGCRVDVADGYLEWSDSA